jgi:hypothetical protein
MPVEPGGIEPAAVEPAAIEPASNAVVMVGEQPDNAAAASEAEAVVAVAENAASTGTTTHSVSPGLFDLLPEARVIDIDPAEEAAKAVAHVNEAVDGADNETARNA